MSNVIKNFNATNHAASSRAFDMAEIGEEAREIIANAEETARHILDEAALQAEALRKEGYAHGVEDGKAAVGVQFERQVVDEVRRARSREVTELVVMLQEMVAGINEQRDRLVRESKEQLIALALNIARTVVKREVQCAPEIVKLNIDEAIRLSARRSKLLVRVSEADMETLEFLLGGPAALSQGDSAVELVSSHEVPRGGCVIESTAGSVDARVETQLKEIEKALLGER